MAQQALRAGLVDEVYLHLAPILLGDGVRLFEHLGDEAIHLRKISSLDAENINVSISGAGRNPGAYRADRLRSHEFPENLSVRA